MKEPWKNCLLKENSQIQTAILQCPGLLDWQKCGQPGTALYCTVQQGTCINTTRTPPSGASDSCSSLECVGKLVCAPFAPGTANRRLLACPEDSSDKRRTQLSSVHVQEYMEEEIHNVRCHPSSIEQCTGGTASQLRILQKGGERSVEQTFKVTFKLRVLNRDRAGGQSDLCRSGSSEPSEP